MKDIKKYVLGFAFSKDRKELVLIEKQRPLWQKGKFNGIGGKIEEGEDPIDSMVREFQEETGVKTDPDKWQNFGIMSFDPDIMGGRADIYMFRMFDDIIYDCSTTESEEILIVNSDTCLNVFKCMPNLPILIPLALSDEFSYTELNG